MFIDSGQIMTSTCPCCGKVTNSLATKAQIALAYCVACGWNVKRAQQFLVHRQKTTRAGVLFLGVILLLAGAFSPDLHNAVEDGVIILIFLATLYLFAERRLSRDMRLLPSLDQFARSAPAILPAPDSEILDFFNRVRELSCPRPLRFNATTRSARTLTRIIPVVFACWGIHDVLRPNTPIGLAESGCTQVRIWGVSILAMGIALWFLLERSFEKKNERGLMENGQVALGRVTGPKPASIGTPGIMYEFTDAKGTAIQAEGIDIYGKMDEGTYVLVLYDAQMPEKSLAMCGTNYEFAIP